MEELYMQLDKIIESRLSQFIEDHELDKSDRNKSFEYFVNNTILNNHESSGSGIRDELLEVISVGGADDIGIDGLCIKVNGILVQNIDDVCDIIDLYNRLEIEFIFIQAKFKNKFDSGEYGKFINGVSDFLADEHDYPMNTKVKEWLKIKDYLIDDDRIKLWGNSPVVRLYYVVMGNWNNSRHIEAISKKFNKDIDSRNMYGDIFLEYIDIERFKKVLDENNNRFSAVIDLIDTLSLPTVHHVDDSSIILCTADELMKLLVTEDGVLRKGLFNDNVRDYQGETTINQDILHTIKEEPERFVLMNNGVTIICSKMMFSNRKITISNPRVINGCQTCSILYNAYHQKIDISRIIISGKLIATNDLEIINKVVRGTNRQNIVYDEAFECTREFHKILEELFVAISEQKPLKIYYERRAKQYNNNPSVKLYQKVSFRALTQSFVSIFLNFPHIGHKHESRLLQMYKGKIFVDSQSKLPYYVAALINIRTEQLLRSDDKYRKVKPYKAHVEMIIRILADGSEYNINNEKSIDCYCNRVLSFIYDDVKFKELFLNAVRIFEKTSTEWSEERGGDPYGIKESSDFTKFLLGILKCRVSPPISYRGTVVKVGIDKNGSYYGFVQNSFSSYFFHSKENLGLDFSSLLGVEVLYDAITDMKTQREKAVNVRLLSE